MQAGTYFPEMRRMLLFGAPLILTHFWPASILLRGHLALATPSLLEYDPQILERWGCAHEVHLCKYIRAKDFASFHAASRAPCSCHSVSSWEWSSNFGALGLRSWGSPVQIYLSEGFWSRILVWRAIAFVNFKRWIGFRMSGLFRRIDFGGFMSWNTQPNCRALDDRRLEGPRSNSWSRFLPGRPDRSWHWSVTGSRTFSCQSPFFKKATALLSSFFFWPFSRLFINLTMCEWALFPKPTTTLGLVEQAFWRVPPFTKWVLASSFWGNPCKAIETFFHWDSCHWDFGFSTQFSHSAAWKTSEKDSALSFLHAYSYRDGNCNCLLYNTARWLSTANNLLEFFVHAVSMLDHGGCFIISICGLKILHSQILLDTFLHHCLQSVIIRSSFLLINLHIVQFQYGLEFLRLSYS